jgi:class 3 adenylate cyclase/predicted ATPase
VKEHRVQCPACASENPDDNQFCDTCGETMPTACPTCGRSNRAGARFCGGCGDELADPSTSAVVAGARHRGSVTGEAERRQLTVLFCDLVESTAIANVLDPEDMRDIIRAYQDACTGVISLYDGFVARYLGDGILAYFGFPQAHENDAERAINAGLAIIEAVDALDVDEAIAGRLAVRVGISTGTVVVGDVIGTGAAEEAAVVGDTPNLAARLQSFAAPNAVAIGDTTHRLAGGLFECEDLGERIFKGYTDPVRVWRVLRPRRVASRFEAMRTRILTDLVGRDEELAMLDRRWRRASDGDGQALLMGGEPGIGKSRVIREFQGRIAAEAPKPLFLQGSEFYANSALYPFVELFDRMAGMALDDTAEERLDKLEAMLGDEVGMTGISLAAELLSLPLDRYPVGNVSPQRRKEQTIRGLVEYVAIQARRQTALVIFEDAQWYDPTTLDTLGRIVERIVDLNVLVIVTYRLEFSPPWADHAHVTMSTIGRLDQRQASAVTSRVAGGKALPDEVVNEIVARTDGVPLFVEELTKTVLEGGFLTEEDDRFVLAGELPSLAIPTTLHDSLMARFDRYPTVKEVAQVGAVIGRKFSYEVLAAVSSLQEFELNSALSQLVDAGLVFRRGVPPAASYVFKHALVQDVAYASLLKRRRQELHGAIARTLIEEFPGVAERRPEILAHHLTGAGIVDQAIIHWLKAGRAATRRSAHQEAAAHLQRGLDLVDGLDDDSQKATTEIKLQLALGSVLSALKGYGSAAAAAAFERARVLSADTANGRNRRQKWWAMAGLYGAHLGRSQFRKADQMAIDLLDLAEQEDHRHSIMWAHANLAQSRLFLGDFVDSRSHAEAALSLYDSRQDPRHIGHAIQDPRILALNYRGFSKMVLGYPEQGLADHREALQFARDLDHTFSLGFALAISGSFAYTGETDIAEAIADEAIELGRSQDFPYVEAFGTGYRGFVQAQRGRYAEAIELLRDALVRLAAATTSVGTSLFRPVLAHSLGMTGRIDDGLAEVDALIGWTEVIGESWLAAETHRTRGELLLMGGDPDPVAAEAAFKTALDLARQRQARFWELRAATALARLWCGQGRSEDAGTLLTPLYDQFDEGLGLADLVAARQVLAETG